MAHCRICVSGVDLFNCPSNKVTSTSFAGRILSLDTDWITPVVSRTFISYHTKFPSSQLLARWRPDSLLVYILDLPQEPFRILPEPFMVRVRDCGISTIRVWISVWKVYYFPSPWLFPRVRDLSILGTFASRARNDTAFIRLLYVRGILVFYVRSDTVLEWCSHAASNNCLNHILVWKEAIYKSSFYNNKSVHHPDLTMETTSTISCVIRIKCDILDKNWEICP